VSLPHLLNAKIIFETRVSFVVLVNDDVSALLYPFAMLLLIRGDRKSFCTQLSACATRETKMAMAMASREAYDLI
jgi:hypothetical protein